MTYFLATAASTLNESYKPSSFCLTMALTTDATLVAVSYVVAPIFSTLNPSASSASFIVGSTIFILDMLAMAHNCQNRDKLESEINPEASDSHHLPLGDVF